jgi:hypothetical protein
MNQPSANIRARIVANGFAVIRGTEFCLPALEKDAWRTLADDWDHLETDAYMADGGRYRLRRFGRFLFVPARSELRRLDHGPVFQSRDVNGFAGGIHRDFASLRESTYENPCLSALIHFDFGCFEVAEPRMLHDPWEVWVHQIRIETSQKGVGRPAPEGVHHDGHDFISMHLVKRENVSGGASYIYDNAKNQLHACLLEHPLDTIYADDHRVMHNVDPIHASDKQHPAQRDVLIIDYDHKLGLLHSR